MRAGRRKGGGMLAALAVIGAAYVLAAVAVWQADRASAQVFGTAWDVAAVLHVAAGLAAIAGAVSGLMREAR